MSTHTPLTLASASPARLATLRSAGIEPSVRVSSVDEPAVLARTGVTDPEDVALLLAKEKAENVAGAAQREYFDEDGPAPGLVLGCDSVLDLDGAALGKPADADEAVRRWKEMRGRSGRLCTGHWLIDLRDEDEGGTGGTLGAVSVTTVHFAKVTDAEIEAYVATGEPLAVAGAFTVDGLGGPFVSGIEGDFHGVVGVSLPLLRDLAKELGVAWPSLWTPRDR
ncbi:Maf family nucleotide pyrophosphatase [Kineosporia rhizophila]|uniref:Maf family protein n=1 Tax=Kineosporia TaxID=49184 RepID=UPI001E52FAFF|nr:nucleoside triphosphate pyrophosphatase [Kineosporia sp. NBRC 101677]MCE0536804.1 Maf family nucleotide pyrophosphatase [Kineosporia rhizophila]